MLNKRGTIILSIAAGLASAGVFGFTADTSPAAEDRAPAAVESDEVQRGRYLVEIAGCNDCHTSGYLVTNGSVPEADWLTGDTLGFRGPWGTTYASNLRLYMQKLSEDDWVDLAAAIETRPPMPWFNLRKMSEEDLRAMHRYIRHLGPAGQEAPAALAPDEEPATAFILFVPQAPRPKM